MSRVLLVLGFIIAFIGMGSAAYGLVTENGLSNMLVIGIVLMLIGAIIAVWGYKEN